MEGRQRNGQKRHSGVFDQSIPGLQRRTSKRAQSSDRHGQIYTEDFAQGGIRTVAPDTAPVKAFPLGSPGNKSSVAASPSASGGLYGQSQAHDRSTNSNVGIGQQPLGTGPGSPCRPRTRTMEEVVRDRSPSGIAPKGRSRLGSVNAISATTSADSSESSSIGFPSIVGFQQTTQQRHRLVKSPPRPLSPAADKLLVTAPPMASPSTDTARILQLMKTTTGRMHGILSVRTTKSGAWVTGYCAINVASGNLVYQMKGDPSHAKTLIPDLRGCKVRTQTDQESQSSFLEISTRALSSCVHLRPHVPETFDSWLAALLCWQPLRPRESHNRMHLPQASWAKSKRNSDRRRNSTIHLIRDAAIIKVGKMLHWDHHDVRVSSPSVTRRISTYKQLRSASGTHWRRVSCTLQENGLLKLYLESDTSLLHILPLSSLTRSAIQRLHPTVLEDEFCIAIYPQYGAASADIIDIKQPIYLSLESRVLFEVWFVLLRAFAVPELYGPEQPSLRASVDLSVAEKQQIYDFENLFRVEKFLSLRIIEAKIHSPEAATHSTKKSGKLRSPTSHDWTNGDYHTEVLLDGEVRGRSATKPGTSNPFWREDYEFIDLPPALSSAAVALKSRGLGQKDWISFSDDHFEYNNGDVDNLGKVADIQAAPLDVIVGTVNIETEEMDRNRDYEQWWPLANESKELVGGILMKVRVDEIVVLMSRHYEPVSDLIHSFSNGLTQQIASAYPGDGRRLHETLLNIFQYSGRAGDWITSLIEEEIDGLHKDLPAPRYRYSRRIASNDSYDSGVEREMFLRDMGKNATQEANLLFRGNSLLTKSLDFHMRRLGKEYLEETLGERIRDIDESDPDCEVDPNRIRNKEDLLRNWRNLIALTEGIWMSIKSSPNRCPPELRGIFRHIRSCAEDRYGDFLRTVSYSSVSGFLFLRFLCPAVLNPKLFGLLKDHPRPRAIRTLTLIAKSLQCLANLSTFGSKEPWMEPMNTFINSHRSGFKAYIDTICAIPTDQNLSRIPPSYTTPITIFSRLPQTSKEGFPSLPYLIDQTRELATLTNLWIEATSGKSDVNDSEELSTFNSLCLALRKRTRDIVNKAMQADRPTSDLQANWAEILENFDRQTRVTDFANYDFEPSSTAKEASPSSSTSGPVAALTRGARGFRPSPVNTRNNSFVSLSSHQNSSTVPSPYRAQSPFQRDTLTGQPSPLAPPPPRSASAYASGLWDPGTGERFPSQAISCDGDEARSGTAEANVPEFLDDSDSLGHLSDIRGPLASPRHVGSIKTSVRSLDVESGSLRDEIAAAAKETEDEKSPTSPRDGRRLADVWGFRKKDKDKDGQKERGKGGTGAGSGASEAGRSDGEGKRGTLTKRNKGKRSASEKGKKKGK